MISNDELDKQTPVSPPIVKRKMNPRVHSIEQVYLIFAP